MPAGPTYEPLMTHTIVTPATSYNLTSIPATYTDLILIVKSQVATVNNSNFIRFNGDTASNYSSTILSGTGSSPYTFRYSNDSRIFIDFYASPANVDFGMDVVHINGYSDTTINKTTISRGASPYGTDLIVGLWRSTAAISSIQVIQPSFNFNAGTTFTLYGVTAA